MAISLTHTTQATRLDAGNGEIRKAQWNEAHTLSMGTGNLVGRTTAGAGAAEEITPGASMSLSAVTLNTVQAITTSSTPSFATLTLSGAAPILTITDTDTGADGRLSASGTVGALYLEADVNNEAAVTLIDFEIDGTSRGTLNASGNLQLDGGIYLGGDTAAVNKLEVYEEGTFTPGLSFGGGTTGLTYTTQLGDYTRVGNLVMFSVTIEINAIGSSTGIVRVTGLPYASATDADGCDTVIGILFETNVTLDADDEAVYGRLGSNTTALTVQNQAITTMDNVNDTDCAAGTIIHASGHYRTDAA